MEVLGYNFANSREEDFVNELILLFNVIFVDQKIASSVIDIRKKIHIKLPDAIIAATAMVDNLCLITRNVEYFKKTECALLNPFDNIPL
jgi:predicted nucleic acid-binding protein